LKILIKPDKNKILEFNEICKREYKVLEYDEESKYENFK